MSSSQLAPVSFACQGVFRQLPSEIAEQILDLSNWPQFTGYGPLPGIRSAEFEVRTPEVVGTRFRVTETNGSTHVEEIIEWDPDRRVVVVMKDFAPPLSRLATHIIETWEFSPAGPQTLVRRRFDLHPKSILARGALWLISFLLKAAINRHLRIMQAAASKIA